MSPASLFSTRARHFFSRLYLGIGLWALAPASMVAAAFHGNEIIGQPAEDFSFFTAEGASRKISDYRGKWLLLQFGATWSSSAEATIEIFSMIRQKLEGKPFEFVEIYADPTLADAELFSINKFHGARGITERKSLPEMYRTRKLSTWYLINPEGIIRTVGGYQAGGGNQKILQNILRNDPAFAGLSLELNRQEKMIEKAMDVSMQSNDKKAVISAWEPVLEEMPHHLEAIGSKASAISWLKWHPAAVAYLSQVIKEWPEAPDQLKIFTATYGVTTEARLPWVQIFEAQSAKHPESQYLSSFVLLWSALPHEISPEDAKKLAQLFVMSRRSIVMGFLAHYAASQGRDQAAVALFSAQHHWDPHGVEYIPEAIFQHERGGTEGALLLIGSQPGEFTVETANPNQAWQEMLRFASVEDWAKTATFAKRYTAVRPQKAQGLVFQLLAALRTDKREEAEGIRKQIEELFAKSSRYTLAGELLAGNPKRNDFMALTEDHVRFDIALAGILFAEMDGDRERSRMINREAVLSHSANSWEYAILYKQYRESSDSIGRHQPPNAATLKN